MPRGRPAKEKHVKEEETCLSLNFPKNVSCCHCIRSQSEHCEKAWAKDPLIISDEEIKAYIDAWLILDKIGFLFPCKYRKIKKRRKWTDYIIARDKQLKEYEPPDYRSLPNPDTTPTKKPSTIPSTLGTILRSAIKTPIDHFKSIIRGTKLPKVWSPSSKSSSQSSPDPASPTEPLDTIKTPIKKLFAEEEPPLSPVITDSNNQWEDQSFQPNDFHLSESLSSGDESLSLPSRLITEDSNKGEEHESFQPNDPQIPIIKVTGGLVHQIQSQESVYHAPSASQPQSQVSALFHNAPQVTGGLVHQIQSQESVYHAPSASQPHQPLASALFHNAPQVTGGLVHQIQSQESAYHAPSASQPHQPLASALYHNGAAALLDCVSAERRAERPPSINTSHLQGTHSQHPMLNSMGIKSSSLDDSDKGRISDLISEIVDVCRMNDIPLDFKYKGNYRPARLFTVPRCSTEESFQRVQRSTEWLTKLIAYAATGGDETGPNDAAEWILDFLGKEFENGFYKIANRMGLHYGKHKKMCPISTSAMIADANITLMQTRIIVRHMTNYFGRSLIVSIDKVRSVTDGWVDVLTPPVFSTFKFYDKDNPKKKPEIVKIWVRDPLEAMTYDMKLVIDEMRKNGGPRQFGYLLDNLLKGVNVLIGSDHGIGSLQLLAKLLYFDALYRRQTGKIEEGARVTQYGCIVCKKDKEPIMAQVAPTMEKTITALETSMMIGVEDEDNNIDLVCIPKNVRDSVRTSVSNGKVELCWPIEDGETKRIHLKHLTSKDVRIWPIIENFYYNIAGDIAYFHTIQGRDGTSSCRCPYCDLKIGDWKKSRDKGNLLTIDKLRECEKTYFEWVKDCEKAKAEGKKPPKKPDTLGVSGKIHCSADPQRYILPILHLLIGLLNKSLQELRDWLDVKVELIGEEEMKMRKELVDIMKDLAVIDERVEAIKVERQECYNKKWELHAKIVSGEINNEEREELERVEQKIKDLSEEQKELINRKPKLREKLNALKKKVRVSNNQY